VRELRAEVLRWAVFCDDEVGVDDLAPEILGQPPLAPVDDARPAPVRPGLPLAEVVATAERTAVAAALEAHHHNLVHTARALGVDRNTLKRKLTAYGLRR